MPVSPYRNQSKGTTGARKSWKDKEFDGSFKMLSCFSFFGGSGD
jgi:hypothetical protein